MSKKTPKEVIADLERKIVIAKNRARKFDDRAKIVIGGGLLGEMRKDAKFRQWFLNNATRICPRQQDKDALRDVLEELQNLPQTNASQAVDNTLASTIPDQNSRTQANY